MKTTAILAAAVGAGAVFAAPHNEPAKIVARASGSSTGSSSLPSVTVKGNAFFAGDKRFYVRGVDYQPGGSSQAADPLADYEICSRDIPYFKELGLNTIRVYTVDNSKNHDKCMAALADAGIYLALDVNTPKYSLMRNQPAKSYNPTYLQSVFATIDAFAGYSNTLLFFSGNEVINSADSTTAAPFVKAVTRDMKQYIGERGYRPIPVGYSAADVSANQFAMAKYMDCGEDPSRSDFYSMNNYEWCDPSSYTKSGWSALVKQYADYSKPLFFSEYGCITNKRTFDESKALYDEDMTSVFSGGLVYEYAEEGSGYGLVKISGNNVSPIGQQFEALGNALNSTQDPPNNGGYRSASGEAQQCPTQSNNWDTKPFVGSALPAMPSDAEKYMKDGAGDGPGLGGSGSQEAGDDSVATASPNAGAVTATFGNGAAAKTGSSSSGTSTQSSSAGQSLAMGRVDTVPLVCLAATFVSFACGAALL